MLLQFIHGQGGALDAIEAMLRAQVVAAIGKVVGPADFGEYMDFHNRRLFKAAYRPRGFCFAVRRPEHYPEGTLSLEVVARRGDAPQPIQTTVMVRDARAAMRVPLSASADLAFLGRQYLHACVLHRPSRFCRTLFQIERTALHSYGPDPHSC